MKPMNNKKGKLYVVSTPIGNKDDITLRALGILGSADIVAAEDTRNTGQLLAHHNIRAKLVSCHEHNETERIPSLIDKLERGVSVALVSDAGTPSVSDPGYRLVKEAITNEICVVPVPGVSAAITALSVAGLPTDTFVFAGFPPKKKGKRLKLLERLASTSGTLVFYESPKRILAFIEDIMQVMGNRQGVLAREMTKLHEEFLRGDLSHILGTLKERPSLKGECTLLIMGCQGEEAVSMAMVRSEIEKELKITGTRVSELSKRIAKKYGLPKKAIYEEALKINSSSKF